VHGSGGTLLRTVQSNPVRRTGRYTGNPGARTEHEPESEPTPRRDCNPNYSGGCVPNAKDVDCEGGPGDGPKYVRGPLRATGEDVYGLDGDNDGVACENGGQDRG
jgi:hypothetical protein